MKPKKKARLQAGPVITRTRIVDRARAGIKRATIGLVYWRILPPRWADRCLLALQAKGARHGNS